MMREDLKALRIDRDQKKSGSRGPASWLILLVGLFLGAVITFSTFQMYFSDHEMPAQSLAAADLDAVSRPEPPTVEAGEPILIASGYIVPHHRIEVGSRIVGKISWVGVEKGDLVEKHQLLVKLDDSEFRAQHEQAVASRGTAAARLEELEAGTRPEEIERAAAELERARADLRNAQLEHRRLRALQDSGIISEQMLDDADSRKDMARAASGVAEKNHRLAVLGPRQEEIDSARAELERASATVRYWETQLALTEIRAPVAGTVLERVAEEGEMVSTSFAGGAVVVALADLADLQVELEISQSDFHHIDERNGCEMSPIAYPDREYTCAVVEIAPEANRQRATIQVKVQVLEPDAYLRPEMDAEVTFLKPEENDE